ncbi:MAG: hypothetical protein IJ795_00215 [Bacteroidales bacterium]|nr:hypothetical protein [Bacteroidales bacterium]
MNWKDLTWKNLGKGLAQSGIAILKGEFLMRLRVERFFPHILYLFFLVWMLIWIGIKSESTQLEVERNKAELSDIKIYHAQKTVQMMSLNRMTGLEKLLEDKGSEVRFPEKPADKLK